MSISLGFHKTTIYREIKRNKDFRSGHYKGSLAHRKCRDRHINKPKKIYLTATVIDHIEQFIKADYSPEQVTGICRKQQLDCVSHEAIFKYIWK